MRALCAFIGIPVVCALVLTLWVYVVPLFELPVIL